MELRLSQFVTGIETITDINNLDYSNPVMFNMPHPQYVEGAENPGLIGQLFRMVAAVKEPAYLGLPINGIWVVLDPYSLYYRQVLKLVSIDVPSSDSASSIITDGGFGASWSVVSRYDQMFATQQTTSGSTTGPKGATGDKGITDKGTWSNATSYVKGQGVRYKGGYWVSRTSNVNRAPDTNAPDWFQLSAPGDQPEVDYDYILSEVRAGLGWAEPA